MSPHVRTWLYAPGHRPELIEKALVAGADSVVIDLQDSVPAEQKVAARKSAQAIVSNRSIGDEPQCWIRINEPTSAWGAADLDALSGARGIDGLRLPRCEDPAVVHAVATECGLPLQLLLETALGLMRAPALAAAHERVVGIGLGEADLAADLRVRETEGMAWARGWVVAAARSCGLSSPIQSVWTAISDLDGLRKSTEEGKALGFMGRSVVHPRQIPIVHEVFTPTPTELESARAVLASAVEANKKGEVVTVDPAGGLVDPAVIAQAANVLDMAPPLARDEEHKA